MTSAIWHKSLRHTMGECRSDRAVSVPHAGMTKATGAAAATATTTASATAFATAPTSASAAATNSAVTATATTSTTIWCKT